MEDFHIYILLCAYLSVCLPVYMPAYLGVCLSSCISDIVPVHGDSVCDSRNTSTGKLDVYLSAIETIDKVGPHGSQHGARGPPQPNLGH